MRGESGTEAWKGLAPGDLVAGKYRVTRILGDGGMGIVAEAVHEKDKHRVAIKVLRPNGEAAAEAAARFLFEAKAAAQMKSVHVAQVLEVSSLENGAPYFVMEYLEGHHLAAAIQKSGALPVATAVDYLLQTCEALAEAHSAGIVHGDLKPSNLFLTQTAEGKTLVKLLDFGISKDPARAGKPESPDVKRATPKSVVGSALYMAPEQLNATRRVDHRTDIWSLGIVMHEILTSHMPFVGKTVAEVSAAVAKDSPIPIRMQRAAVPAAVETVILQCLEKEPEHRFQNVGDLANALLPFGPSDTAQLVAHITSALARATNVTAAPPPLEVARISFPAIMVQKAPRVPLVAAPVEASSGWFETTTPGISPSVVSAALAPPSTVVTVAPPKPASSGAETSPPPAAAVTAPPPATAVTAPPPPVVPPPSARAQAAAVASSEPERPNGGWTETTMPGVPPPRSRSLPASMPKLGRASSPRLDAVGDVPTAAGSAPEIVASEQAPEATDVAADTAGSPIAELVLGPAIVAEAPAPKSESGAVSPPPSSGIAEAAGALAPVHVSTQASREVSVVEPSTVPIERLVEGAAASSSAPKRAALVGIALLVALAAGGVLRALTGGGKTSGTTQSTAQSAQAGNDHPQDPTVATGAPSTQATPEMIASPAIRRPDTPAVAPVAEGASAPEPPKEAPGAGGPTTAHVTTPAVGAKPRPVAPGAAATPAPSGTAAFGVSRE